ncbi:MAG: Ig-like domain-containing protein [Saccharofermentanales bacterium]
MKKKLLVILSCAILFGAFYLFDYIWAHQFAINLISVSPDPAEADGQTPITISVQLTDKHGNPVANHSLFAFSLGGGMFKANRELTDKEGKTEFTYFPYRASAMMDLKDVEIRVIDESNSVFIEINTTNTFTVRLVEPQKQNDGSTGQDDIFGEDG